MQSRRDFLKNPSMSSCVRSTIRNNHLLEYECCYQLRAKHHEEWVFVGVEIGFMYSSIYEFWRILTSNMTYTRLQKYTNLVVGEHEIQTFKVVTSVLLLLLLLFDTFVPNNAHPLFFWTSGLSKCTYISIISFDNKSIIMCNVVHMWHTWFMYHLWFLKKMT
jgi:hypothetical protein